MSLLTTQADSLGTFHQRFLISTNFPLSANLRTALSTAVRYDESKILCKMDNLLCNGITEEGSVKPIDV